MPEQPAPRIAVTLALMVAAALTAILAARTFWYLFHSVTNVPYGDQWLLLGEIVRKRAGQSGWSYLWSPYWGQRIVLPRLLILLSVEHLRYSMLPFVITNAAAQISMVVTGATMVRLLFSGRHSWRYWISMVAGAHLILSSLQMEILVEGIGIQYTIGYASAAAAIAILGMARTRGASFRARFWTSIVLGLMSTACLTIGLLVWPILIFEVWLARAHSRYLAAVTASSAVLVPAYLMGYARPEMGMGFHGVILHPIEALRVIALVLGGPVSIYSRPLGMAAGTIGLIAAGGLLFHFGRDRFARPGTASLLLVACFLIGSAFAIAVGRISPQYLNDVKGQALPSRYLLPTLLFWAALFPVSLACVSAGRWGWLNAGSVSMVVLALTFGTWTWQWRLPREWASVSESYDAIASGFLVAAADPQYMSSILGDEEFRARMVDYMRQQHLSVFAEPRAGWIGEAIGSIGTMDPSSNCRATVTASVPLSGDPPAIRVVGALTVDGAAPRRRLDILMTDSSGMVKGLAKTQPAESEFLPATGFFGYTRGNAPEMLRMYVRFPDARVCPVQTQ